MRYAQLYIAPWQQHKGDVKPTVIFSWDFPWLFLGREWMPIESELEGENECGWRQNDLGTGTVPTDQDDPTSISRRSLQAALTAILDGLGILLLIEATWIPLVSYSWDLRAFTVHSYQQESISVAKQQQQQKEVQGMTWNIPVRIFFHWSYS